MIEPTVTKCSNIGPTVPRDRGVGERERKKERERERERERDCREGQVKREARREAGSYHYPCRYVRVHVTDTIIKIFVDLNVLKLSKISFTRN